MTESSAPKERRLIPVTPVAPEAPDEPIACTLTPEQGVHRLGEWRALIGEAAGPAQAIEGGAVLHFPHTPDLEARVRALSEAEKACCAFFEFEVRVDGGDLMLVIGAPDDALPVLEELVGGLP